MEYRFRWLGVISQDCTARANFLCETTLISWVSLRVGECPAFCNMLMLTSLLGWGCDNCDGSACEVLLGSNLCSLYRAVWGVYVCVLWWWGGERSPPRSFTLSVVLVQFVKQLLYIHPSGKLLLDTALLYQTAAESKQSRWNQHQEFWLKPIYYVFAWVAGHQWNPNTSFR